MHIYHKMTALYIASMKFDPAYVNLDRELPLCDPAERRERVSYLAVDKSPDHLADIVKKSPDSLIARMAYHFQDSLQTLLTEANGSLDHMTRGRILLALAQAYARRVHEMEDLPQEQIDRLRVHFSDLASKALNAFRRSRAEYPLDAYQYAATALEIKGKLDPAIREMKKGILENGSRTPSGFYANLGSLHLSKDRFTKEYLTQRGLLIENMYPNADQDPLLKVYWEYYQLISKGTSYKHQERLLFLERQDHISLQIEAHEASFKEGSLPPYTQNLLNVFRDWYKTSKTHQRAQHQWHALQAFHKALNHETPFHSTWTNLASLYKRMGRSHMSRKALENGVSAGVVAAEYLLGHWYVEHSNEDPGVMRKAIPLLESYLQKTAEKSDEVGNVFVDSARELLDALKDME